MNEYEIEIRENTDAANSLDPRFLALYERWAKQEPFDRDREIARRSREEWLNERR